MFFLDEVDKFFITLWRSCDAGDKFSITLWRSCDAEFITLSAEQRRDKVNYHPPSLTNKLGNNDIYSRQILVDLWFAKTKMVKTFCPELYLGVDLIAQIQNFLESIQM